MEVHDVESGRGGQGDDLGADEDGGIEKMILSVRYVEEIFGAVCYEDKYIRSM